MAFVLAHLSDPHIPPLPPVRVLELANKRITGYLNWRWRRGEWHHRDVLDALVRDLRAQNPDHVALTGDLANLALDAEFSAGRDLLGHLGAPENVTVIPGNHDNYVGGAEAKYMAAWLRYMEPDIRGDYAFPFVRIRGQVAVIALSTAVLTLPFFATGQLGRAQIKKLATILEETETKKLFRVVLIHHPPAGKRSLLRRLTDARMFRSVIKEYGAELILSGHDHRAAVNMIKGPRKPVPVVQVTSASAPHNDKHGGAAFNLYEIDGKHGAWTIEMITREVQADGSFKEKERRKLA
jgi:3',5'-cyclic AMP phosphodiesterase CpdA